MKTLWDKWKAVAPWIMLASFILMFIIPAGWLPGWATIATVLIAGPAIITVYWENEQERKRRIYQQGYQDGQRDKD